MDINQILHEKLTPLHQKLLNFNPLCELKNELPEQIMACQYIEETDCVLELGGSIGRNSCVINSLLKDKSKHVVLEPSTNEIAFLINNKNNNDLKYNIEIAALSSKPLYSLGWETYEEKVENSNKINCITLSELREKYKLPFNVLIIDNEGNFVKTLKDFPDILNEIRLIIIEHDFKSHQDLDYFFTIMQKNNFKIQVPYLKTDQYGPGMYWKDGIVGDPIFVSAWIKN